LKKMKKAVTKSPRDVPALAERAESLLTRLEVRHGLLLEGERSRIERFRSEAKREHTKQRVCAVIALLDSLLIRGDKKGILALVAPERGRLRALLEKQLDSFLSGGLKVLASRHIVKSVRLSNDLRRAEGEADYAFEFEHAESSRRIKGVRHKRFILVERSGRWLIDDLH